MWCDVDVVEFSYYGAPAPTPKEQLYDELVDGLRGSDPIVGSGSQVTFFCSLIRCILFGLLHYLTTFLFSSNGMLCYNHTMTGLTAGLQCFLLHQNHLDIS